MKYHYPFYKKFYPLAVGWVFVFSLLRYQEIWKVLEGDTRITLLFYLFMQIVFVPVSYLIAAYIFKSISVISVDEGILYRSWRKSVLLRWEEVELIKLVGKRKIVLSGGGLSFSFWPVIRTAADANDKVPTRDMFKKCLLLKEILEKSMNAKLEKFDNVVLPE